MPSFADRVALIGRAVVGLFDDSSARQAQGMLGGIWPAAIGDPPTRGARERVAAFADMPWLHALADKVAFAFASIEWTLSVRKKGSERATREKTIQRAGLNERKAALRALKQAGELVPIESHPMLDMLSGGNSFMTGLDVRYLTSLYFDLEGEAFWIKERNGLGVVIGAWPIPPDWVRALPTPSSRFFRVGFRGWHGAIPDTEIAWFQRPNPSNPYGRGTGLARALADELETDEMAAKTIRQSFLNQMRPDFIVFPKDGGNWDEAQRRRLQHEWEAQHTGFWRQFKARFAAREVGVFEFSQKSFREQQMTQLREFQRDLIRQTWGVPPEVMGIVEPGASRATIDRASYIFARHVLVPRVELFRAQMQERIVPEYDERLILDYVSPIEEDREFDLEAHRALPWAWTIDEHRALVGDEPRPDGAGDVVLVPFNLSPEGGAPASLPAKHAERRVLQRLAGWWSR